MHNAPGTTQGLAPIYVAPDSGASVRFGGNDVTLGARGDSYYECVPLPALPWWLEPTSGHAHGW